MTTKQAFKEWALLIGCIVVCSVLVTAYEHVFGAVGMYILFVIMLVALFFTLKNS